MLKWSSDKFQTMMCDSAVTADPYLSLSANDNSSKIAELDLQIRLPINDKQSNA